MLQRYHHQNSMLHYNSSIHCIFWLFPGIHLMFEGFFKSKQSEQQESKPSANSSTSGTDDLEDKLSPKQQYEEFLIATNKLQTELLYKKSTRKDDYRAPFAYSDGGIRCDDEKQVDKLRSVGKEMVKIIGRKILSGEFNLTKISFPIRACHPRTALYNSVAACTIFPYYMNQAAAEKDPVERFKLVVSCFIATPYYLDMFLKPLNPIIGETLQASLIDGTQIYAEQVSHHPPISYFLIVGPNDSYKFSGLYDFDISPGLNSLTMRNKGKRRVEFKDGTVIEGTYPSNQFSATFIGTTRIEERGQCVFMDEGHKLHCRIEFDKVKKRPSDFFQSIITREEKPICKVFGSYCGYIEFDGERYWDGRDVQPLHIETKKNISLLSSDWSHRIDILEFLKDPGHLDEAQKCKERLEDIQRKDTKLRKLFEEFQEKEEEKRKEEEKQREKEEKKKAKDDEQIEKKKKKKKRVKTEEAKTEEGQDKP